MILDCEQKKEFNSEKREIPWAEPKMKDSKKW